MTNSDPRILAVGTALPGPPVDNARLARLFGMDELWRQWVDTFIGAGRRHLSTDLETGRPGESLAGLAARAAGRALTAARLGPDAIDLVVMGTATPDQLMPATVNMVADQLGINAIPTYQLQSGCSGAVQALEVAHRFLQAGAARRALVIGADSTAKYFDVKADLGSLPPAQLVNFLLFGDGAGAVVLAGGDTVATGADRGQAVVRRVETRLTGLGRAPGQTLEWYGSVEPDTDRPAIGENYKVIEESVPVMAAEILRELLEGLGWSAGAVDYVLPPQLSIRMTARILEGLGLPGAEEVSCIADTGNTGNALPFLQLERALSEMVAGERAVAVAVESSKWIKAGFAFERI